MMMMTMKQKAFLGQFFFVARFVCNCLQRWKVARGKIVYLQTQHLMLVVLVVANMFLSFFSYGCRKVIVDEKFFVRLPSPTRSHTQ